MTPADELPATSPSAPAPERLPGGEAPAAQHERAGAAGEPRSAAAGPAPLVSFVVPCYRLAHLLPECVHSILGQSFGDLEVIIMDDCSPDDTQQVAHGFRDPRVRVVRNQPNLGALRNFNKGIGLARGRYVWLISADDYLRRPHVLQRYVDVMERNPQVGFVFCPGVAVRDGAETQLLGYSSYGRRDRIEDGRSFLRTLLNYNKVLAPAAMARTECYRRISDFPILPRWADTTVDMIWGGDWYLWCAFALRHDVAYLAEPMVCYREHDLSMTNTVTQERLDNCLAADLAVPWMIKRQSDALGLPRTSRDCLRAIALEYGRQLAGKRYQWLGSSRVRAISMERFEQTLRMCTQDAAEQRYVRARVCARLGDNARVEGRLADARRHYRAALAQDLRLPRVYGQLVRSLLARPSPGPASPP